ncbi:MAG: hypothetical protein IKA31_02090 [Clostridia bacterium]|nr:hypothetical protein [Clostridia bacterium]
MSKIGYKNVAILYTLEDEKIQQIKCKENTRKYTTSSFMGSGKLTQGQTLEIATQDKLDKKIKAGAARCFYNGNTYMVVGVFDKDIAPIKQKTRQIKDNILSLQ